MDRLNKYLDSWKSADPSEFPFSDKNLLQIIEDVNSTEISTHKFGIKKMLITSTATLGTIAAILIGLFAYNPSADLPISEATTIDAFATTTIISADSLSHSTPKCENKTVFDEEMLQLPTQIRAETVSKESYSAQDYPALDTFSNSPRINPGNQFAPPRLTLKPIDSSLINNHRIIARPSKVVPHRIIFPQGANPFIHIPLHPKSVGSMADYLPNYSKGQGYRFEELPNYNSDWNPVGLEDIPERINLPDLSDQIPIDPEESDSIEEAGQEEGHEFEYAADMLRGAEHLIAAPSFSLDSANAVLNSNDIFITYADDEFAKHNFLLDSTGENIYYVDSEMDTTIGPLRYTVAQRVKLVYDDEDTIEYCNSVSFTFPTAPALLSMVSSDMRNLTNMPLVNVKMLPPETKKKIGIENLPAERRVIMATRYSRNCNLFTRDELSRAGYPPQGIALYSFSTNANGEIKYSLLPYDTKSIDSLMPTSASVVFMFDTLGHYHTISSENHPLIDSLAQTYFVRELDALNKGITFDLIKNPSYFANIELLHLDFGKSEYPIANHFVMFINTIGFDSSRYYICSFHPFTTALADAMQEVIKIEKDSDGKIVRNAGRASNNSFGYENNVLADGIVRDGILRSGKPLPGYQRPTKCKKTDSKLADKIDCLTLSTEELKKIGVEFNERGLSFKTEEIIDLNRLMTDTKDSLTRYGYDTSGRYILLRTKYDIDTGDYTAAKYRKHQMVEMPINENLNTHFRELPIPYNGWRHDVYDCSCPIGASLVFNSSTPVDSEDYSAEIKNYQILCSIFKKYSTSLMGNYSNIEELLDLSYVNPNEPEDMQLRNRISKYRPLTDRLLPVELYFGNCDKSVPSDYSCGIVQIWFFVDREFANLLPKRYRKPILKELDVLDRVDRGELEIGEACKELKEERSYFGLCELENSVISDCRVAPVPCSLQELKVDFILTKPSDIRINLYSLNSENAAAGFEFKGLDAGPNSLRIDLSDVNNGVYLLEVSDGKGNSVKRKIVVAR